MAAGSTWVARITDPRIVLGVAIAILVASVASLTVRVVVGRNIDIAGTVIDARTHKAVPGAHIVAMGIHERTNPSGAFTVLEVHSGTKLRFSADNYKYADLEATTDPMRVSLRPIPVTGKVTSAFTTKGIGASVRGKEITKSRADGTFTTYGVGPGDTLTITAFGHQPKTVKIAPSRKVAAALSLGTINPAALLRSVSGYGYVDSPPEVANLMRSEMAASDPEINAHVSGVAAKSILRNGKSIGIAIVVALDPRYAALPGTHDGFFKGFSMGSDSSKTIKVGEVPVREATGAGLTGYAWQKFAGFVMVFGQPKADTLAFVRGLILGDTVSA